MVKKIAVLASVLAAAAAIAAAVLAVAYTCRARRAREYFSFDFPENG